MGILSFCLCSFFEWQRKAGHKQPFFIHFAEAGASEEMREAMEAKEEEEEGTEVERDTDVVVEEEGKSSEDGESVDFVEGGRPKGEVHLSGVNCVYPFAACL